MMWDIPVSLTRAERLPGPRPSPIGRHDCSPIRSLTPTFSEIHGIITILSTHLSLPLKTRKCNEKIGRLRNFFCPQLFPHLFVYFFVSLIQESPSMECPTDVLRFTDPKVGNALRSLDFMADAYNMPAAEAKPVAIVISITIKGDRTGSRHWAGWTLFPLLYPKLLDFYP